MRIEINNDSVCLGNGRVIEMEDFPEYYKGFLNEDTGSTTANVEKVGADILKDGLDNVECVNKFVLSVFKWGGKTGNRVRGLVYPQKNKSEKDKADNEIKVAQIVAEAARILKDNDLELALKLNGALKKIRFVDGLCVSYGSKILRMLLPQQAGAYDSILQTMLSSYYKSGGYAEFCADCKKVAGELKKSDIKSHHRENGEWFVADVEAVIFHYLRPIYRDEAKIKND